MNTNDGAGFGEKCNCWSRVAGGLFFLAAATPFWASGAATAFHTRGRTGTQFDAHGATDGLLKTFITPPAIVLSLLGLVFLYRELARPTSPQEPSDV